MNRGLLVGINAYPSAPLDGCVNDVTDMETFIVNRCGFSQADIRVLTDSGATTQAIMDGLGWLIAGLQAGDRILFHYSGHGAQMPSQNPQGAVDAVDDVICPVDFDWTPGHAIRGTDFERMFAAVPSGVEFVWISDSCYSGGLAKALRPFPHPQAKRKTLAPPPELQSHLLAAQSGQIRVRTMLRAAAQIGAALIAACQPNQEAADSWFNNRPNGALTYFLLRELQGPRGLTELLTDLVTAVTSDLSSQGYDQRPDLAGSQAIIRESFLAS